MSYGATRSEGGLVVALSGGIGGAKLALGLKRILAPGALSVIANTGDDFEHLGLTVSPDIDTLIYTLAGVANAEQGWGRAGETWSFMGALKALGGPDWFQLGDGDLAMHVMRSHRLAAGATLTAITAELARALDVGAEILPMSDLPVRTKLETRDGLLDFQDYFVRLRAAPVITGIRYEGAAEAGVTEAVRRVLARDDLAAIVIAPSNPLISIEPILAVPGMRAAIGAAGVPVVAVSPVIRGQAVKGPTAKMLHELGEGASARAVLGRYAGLIDGFIADETDAAELEGAVHGVTLVGANVMMRSLDDRERLARLALDTAWAIRNARA
jgi:LPPG:FO 2-phospho-L-lactate transferase